VDDERVNQVVEELTFEWGEAGGFFFDLRDRKFNSPAFERVKRLLESIEFGGEKLIPKSIVGLIWSAPIFMEDNARKISGIDDDSLYNPKIELYRIIESKLEG